MEQGSGEVIEVTSLPRIAVFSPMPPVPSGISDYTADLLPFLAQRLEIDLWVDQRVVTAPEATFAKIVPWSLRNWQSQCRSYDLTIYQMGNSPAHAYMLDALHVHPGLVVMHDFVLHHLIFWKAVTSGQTQWYRELMTTRYGDAGAQVSRDMLLGRSPLGAFECPLCEDVVASATGILCHSGFVAKRVSSIVPDNPIWQIPMGVPSPLKCSKTVAREALRLPNDGTLALSIGHINPYKGLELVFRVLRRIGDRWPLLKLVLAGSVSPQYPLARLIDAHDVADKIIFLGRVSAEQLPVLLSAVDFSFSLRYPTAGETSASLLRSLSYGVPGIVTDVGAFSELPDACCPKIPVGPEGEDVLEAYTTALLQIPALLIRASCAARDFIVSRHTMLHAANSYFAVVGSVLGCEIPPLEGVDLASNVPETTPAMTDTVPPLPEPLTELLDKMANDIADLGWGRSPDLAIHETAKACGELFGRATATGV